MSLKYEATGPVCCCPEQVQSFLFKNLGPGLPPGWIRTVGCMGAMTDLTAVMLP